MSDSDVPSPIDFHDPAQVREWVEATTKKKPWRERFFAVMVSAINDHFDQDFTVLELGSGPGHLAAAILGTCPVARYTALDFSEPMHQMAREQLAPFAAKVEYVTRDFSIADWADGLGQYDLVATIQSAHETRHKRHLIPFLQRARQRIISGGILLYADHYAEPGTKKNSDLYLERADQPRALAEAGYSDVRPLLDMSGMALYAAASPG